MRTETPILLAMLALAVIPASVHGQDYISPSVMRVEQTPAEPGPIKFQNYSYMHIPFENITSNVSISSYLSGENAVHEVTINVSNLNDRRVFAGARASYCKTGSNDCKPLTCDYNPNDIELQPGESKQRVCTITAGDCAGREIRTEYTLQGVGGRAISGKIVKCPQSFCDQITMSISAPEIFYAGDKVFVEGYLSEINKEGVPSPVSVAAGAYRIRTSSNDFGYWRAPLEINRAGYYELSAVSESCDRKAKTTIQVFRAKEEAGVGITVYPKSIDVELGGNALLAVQQNSDESVPVSLAGVPESWVEPAKFAVSRGTRFVYIFPKSAGSYTIAVRAGSEEKNVSLFVAAKKPADVKKESSASVLVIFLIAAFFLFSRKSPANQQERKEYLGIVKKEIENSGRLF